MRPFGASSPRLLPSILVMLLGMTSGIPSQTFGSLTYHLLCLPPTPFHSILFHSFPQTQRRRQQLQKPIAMKLQPECVGCNQYLTLSLLICPTRSELLLWNKCQKKSSKALRPTTRTFSVVLDVDCSCFPPAKSYHNHCWSRSVQSCVGSCSMEVSRTRVDRCQPVSTDLLLQQKTIDTGRTPSRE